MLSRKMGPSTQKRTRGPINAVLATSKAVVEGKHVVVHCIALECLPGGINPNERTVKQFRSPVIKIHST